MARNIFKSLFSYRPRDGVTPRENYLTEAFAYVLDASEKARLVFAERVIPKIEGLGTISGYTIRTQESFEGVEPGSDFDRPDMLIEFHRSGKDDFVIYSEHKWESDVDRKQLERYSKQVANHCGSAVLVFVGSSIEQRAEAKDCGAVALLWEEVFDLLKPLYVDHPQVADFLDFLDAHGLSPHAPLSLTGIAAYSCAVDVPKQCRKVVQRLYDKKLPWQPIPEFYRNPCLAAKPIIRWGRVGIEFYRNVMSPQIFVGFLLDPEDHALEFTDRHRGIDLALFIECDPPTVKPKGAVWAQRAQALRRKFAGTTIRVRTHEGILQRKWRKFAVQECLADVIREHHDDEAQINAIYDRLCSWAEVMFEGGALEQAMHETWMDLEDGAGGVGSHSEAATASRTMQPPDLPSEEYAALMSAGQNLGLSDDELDCAMLRAYDADGVEMPPSPETAELRAKLFAASGIKL